MNAEATSPDLPVREWDEQLRARGYRVTPQRQLVLEAVARLDHATPEEIGAQVQQTARGVNISTIYRTLELLEQIGMVTHTHLGHGAPIYHLASDADHVHLVCRQCGRVSQIGPDAIRPLITALDERHGFETDVGHLTVFGRCRDCRAAAVMSAMRSPLLAQPGAVEAGWPDEGVAAHYGDPMREQRALDAFGRAGGPVQPRRADDLRPGPAELAAQPDHAAPGDAGGRAERPGPDPQPDRARGAPPHPDRRRDLGVGARGAGDRGGPRGVPGVHAVHAARRGRRREPGLRRAHRGRPGGRRISPRSSAGSGPG